MRNLDLDQYWPIPPRRMQEAALGPSSESTIPLPLSQAAVPPPLPLTREALEPPSELVVAASAGWLETAPPATQSTSPHGPSHASGDDVLAGRVALLEAAFAPPEAVQDDPAPTPHLHASPAKSWNLTPMIWGGSGFVAGMLAWHAVGFWSFVSNVVLNANDPRAQTLEAFLPKLAPRGVQQTSRPVTDVGKALAQPAARQAVGERKFACVALAIDRSAGGTKVATCPEGSAQLRDAGFNKRTDKLALKPRLQDPVAWTGTTAVQVSQATGGTPEQNPADGHSLETGTLSESDLKLDLAADALKIER